VGVRMDKIYIQKAKNVGIIFVVYLIVVLLASLPLYFFNTPYATIKLIFYIITAFFIAITSLITSYFSESKGWFSGLISGACFILLVLIFIILLNGFNIGWLSLLMKIPLLLGVALIAGIIGINLK
jgi:putative membrane protein (TIGR04086 family)